MKSMCQDARRNSPSVAVARPTSRCMRTASAIAASSTPRSAASSISPAACRARASRSPCGRSRLPTWSARNGGPDSSGMRSACPDPGPPAAGADMDPDRQGPGPAHRNGTDTGGMSKRVVVAGAVWVVLSVLAFLADPILGAFVLLFGGIGVVVVHLAGTWEQHPDFEAREQRRAVKRAAKWEKNKDAREHYAAR